MASENENSNVFKNENVKKNDETVTEKCSPNQFTDRFTKTKETVGNSRKRFSPQWTQDGEDFGNISSCEDAKRRPLFSNTGMLKIS